MRRIKWFFMLTLSVVPSVCLVAVMCSPSPVVAAQPTPSSPFIEGFILETDDVYGYEMLRPISWTPIDLRDRRGYLPPNSEDRPNRISLTVTNLQTVSAAFAGKNGLIVNYVLFSQDPSLSAWMKKTEVLWDSLGIRYNLVRELSDARIYAVRPIAEQIQLIAYVVRDGQPLDVVMYGFGTFSNIRELESAGLVADFETMVTSVSAHQGSLVSTGLGSTAPESTAIPTDAGPYHSDSGSQSYGVFTYRLQTDYYQAPPRVYWLYEYMNYRDFQFHTMWLYRTDVTDDPDYSCTFGGGALIEHSIGKHTTSTSGTVTDSFYPNRYVAHLNPTTAHAMLFGDPNAVICKWYFPFTQ